MKSINQITLIILFVFLLNSCRKIECPGFDNNLLCWLPPQESGDSMFYINQLGDTLKLTSITKEISDNYKIRKKSKCSCSANASFIATNDNNDQIKISFDQSSLESENYQNSTGSIYVYFNNIVEAGEFSLENKFNNANDSIINNNIYNIITLTNDTNNTNNKIWKIIYAKNIGIIRIFNRETHEIWSLVE